MKLLNMLNATMQPYMEEADDKGGDGFEDVVINEPSEPNEPIEPTEPTEPKEDTKPTEPVTEPVKIKFKHLHEEKELSLDEATPLIQKGYDYDRVKDQYNTLKGSPVLSYIEKVAKANNMTPEQVVEAWQRNDEQAEINALAERENVPYEIAERLYKTEQKTAQIENSLNADKQTKAQQEKAQAEWLEFENEYPGIAVKDIPKEVLERREQTGKSLADCMAWNENRLLKEENTILKQNAKNTAKAPISSVSKGGSDITTEKVFEGFDD